MTDSYGSSISIGSIEENCLGMKSVYRISIEKLVWVLKVLDLQDVITQFFTCFILFE